MRREGTGLDLSRIIFIGRTFDEYVKMFDLTEDELSNNEILDAPGGACSFTATARQLGYASIATDIAYNHPVEQLYKKGIADIQHAVEGLARSQDYYNWHYFESVRDLEKHRLSALNDCVKHMEANPDLYVPSVLPELPFADDQFDLILSAHFLFMYADRLDLEFHRKTILEMIRVARNEIRIYPLVDLSGNRCAHVNDIIELVNERGWRSEERTVSYAFQKNAHAMLRLYRG